MRDAILVGAGGMGRAWLDVLVERDDVRVSAVVDLLESSAVQAVHERGLDAAVFRTVEAALSSRSFDFLVNATVPGAHAQVSAAALRAGIPVLTEKPVTSTVAEALRLAALSELTGTPLVTSQSRRYSPGISAFRATLDDLGGAAQLVTNFFQNPRFGGFRDAMAHPLLVDMAIHSFDQARYLLDAQPVSVFCDEFNPPWSWYTSGASASAVFSFDHGQRFAYNGSWCADGLTTSWNGAWHGVTAEGSATWDGELGVEFGRRGGQRETVPVPSAAEGISASLEDFLGSLGTGRTASGAVHSNIWSLAMVEAAVTSAEIGERVDFTDVFSRAHGSARKEAAPDVAELMASWSSAYPPRSKESEGPDGEALA